VRASERFYDSQYTSFETGVQAAIRRDAIEEDIGQNGWLSAGEYRDLWRWLDLTADTRVLDVACGSGGPAVFMADSTGCTVTGIDVNEAGLVAAREAARARGLEQRASFLHADANEPLPFADASFDAIVCIDAINHFRDRGAVLREWQRVLAPGSGLAFTDPTVITGPISNEEIAIRASIGFFVFTALGDDERLLRSAGFEVLHVADTTERVEANALAMLEARQRLREDASAEEGADVFEAKQHFYRVAGTLARERRLSRFTLIAAKPSS
jgi:ubiquinone/menaquinone biosynthesis C-methylase UbiE